MAERTTWLDERADTRRSLGRTLQPEVVIIGGGQGGIALAARLKRLGVSTLIVEKNARPGDSWRNRYRSLVLHDPVWYDHLPYLPFPDHWPVFTPKDKMADWLESYVSIMELDMWCGTEAVRAVYDAAAATWAVTVRRDGEEIVLSPRQLVFATGSYGPPNHVRLPGADRFKGETMHSSGYRSGADHRGKRAVVVGGNSSAHDVAMDLHEHGATVTMIQRSPTTVVRSETLMEVAFKPLYSEEALAAGITTEKADLLFASTPFRLMPIVQKRLTAAIRERDADLIARLEAAGFRTDYGVDETGQTMKALRTGSGFYIDVGASDLIADGRIAVRSGVEPTALSDHGVALSDGSTVEADVVVFATGYLPMNRWVAQIVSEEAAALVGPNWGYGSGTKGDPGPFEGELRAMWKPLRHEAMWFHGGNLHLSRFHSLHVALQLKARIAGIATPVFQG